LIQYFAAFFSHEWFSFGPSSAFSSRSSRTPRLVHDSRYASGQNCCNQDIKKALELACLCEHPNAVWLTKLFAGREVASREEARQVFLGREYDPRALSLAGVLVRDFGEIGRAADLGDGLALAEMAEETDGKERFLWAEKCASQGERDGFFWLGYCFGEGIGCLKDAEKAKENFLLASELDHVHAIVHVGELLDEDDPQRFVWFDKLLLRIGFLWVLSIS
jgi:TPR repeat protein